MSDVGIARFDEYVVYLEMHPEEFTALFNTILINVTGFFRDADAWDHLRSEVVPGLLEQAHDRPLRVWSAACASGEEAYSAAMLLGDVLGVDTLRDRVKIYATDIDEEALSAARNATYSERELRGVDEEHLATYFERTGTRYTFRKDLRRGVIFGRNDLVQDAPIGRIDLLLCRNSLMYFNSQAQTRILQRLHFALNPDGVLFLGRAEMLLTHGDLFTPIDLKRRVFRKVATGGDRQRAGAPQRGHRELAPGEQGHLDALLVGAATLAPVAQLVLDRQGTLLMSNARADMLFGIGPRDVGRPFQDLDVSYRPLELRSLVDGATADRRAVWARGVEWLRSGGDRLHLDIQVTPVFDESGAQLGTSVFFHDVTAYRQLQVELEHANRQLETAYEELQSTNEELETTNEELQSTVEELETTNEELQSTNEELETMNEELHSMNDELQASNEELRERTGEVSELNRFMNTVLTSLRAGVAVIDRDLRVQVWNRRSEDLWGLRPDEAVGQDLLSLDIGLPVESLKPLVRQSLVDGTDSGPAGELVVDAVNRRGRAVQVRVSASALDGVDGEPPSGVILVMDVQGESSAAEPGQWQPGQSTPGGAGLG
jgi:two-component system CheB/CheR fusion protein